MRRRPAPSHWCVERKPATSCRSLASALERGEAHHNVSVRSSHIAWFAGAAHVVASVAMLVLLRHGLPPFDEAHRLDYLDAHRRAWTLGWMTWQLAVVSLIALYAVLAMRFGGALSVTAMAASTAGMAIDIATQIRFIAILPTLHGTAFAQLDRELAMLTAYGANGLYTLGFVLLTIAGLRALPKSALVLAVPVALGGFALAAAALVNDARLEIITSALLFPLFTLWIVVIALWLRKSESSL